MLLLQKDKKKDKKKKDQKKKNQKNTKKEIEVNGKIQIVFWLKYNFTKGTRKKQNNKTTKQQNKK